MRRILLLAAALGMVVAQGVWAADTNPPLWSQMPDMNGGLAYSSEVKVPSTVADDWALGDTGVAIPAITWWGSYWKPYEPNDYAPNSASFANAASGGILGFTITIWTNVAGTPDLPYDHPGTAVWAYWATNYTEAAVGATGAGRNVYEYSIAIPDAKQFKRQQGLGPATYWLSIEADLRDGVGRYDATRQWGWMESANNQHNFGAAVQDFKGSHWYTINNNLYSSDMAFIIQGNELGDVPEASGLAALFVGATAIAGLAMKRRYH